MRNLARPLLTLTLLAGLAPIRPLAAQPAPLHADPEIEKLQNEFDAHYQAGRYREALAVVRKVLEIRRKQVGPDHPDIGNLLNNLAELTRLSGDLRAAEPLFLQALAILEKALGPDHLQVATILNNLGAIRLQLGDPNGAEPYLRRALTIVEKGRGPDHPETATMRLNLAQVLGTRGQLAEAERLDRQALAALEKALGPRHPQVLVALNNLAGVLLQQADFAQALPLLERVARDVEATLGPKHPTLATVLNNLAEALAASGAKERARPLFERALEILVPALGDQHPSVLQVLTNYATLLANLGDDGFARKVHESVLARREATLGPEHPAVAESLNYLALLDLHAGKGTEAKAKLERVLAIHLKTVGPGHALVAQTENNLGGALRQLGDLAGAVKLYAQAREHWEKALGPRHPDVANAWNNLGLAHHGAGRYAEAAAAHGKALQIREGALGPHHPAVAVSLGSLAGALQAQGRNGEALALLQRDMAIRELAIQRALSFGTDEQRARAVLSRAADLHRAVSLHLKDMPKDPQALRLALTLVLQRKARGLDAAAEATAALRKHLTPEAKALLTELQQIDARLGALFHKGPGAMGEQAYGKLVSSLQERASELDRRLARAAPRLQEVAGTVTIDKVQAALPEGTALVELVDWLPLDVTAREGTDPVGARRYAAYVLTTKGEPRAVDLGDAAAIDLAATRLKQALNSPDRDVAEPARELDAKLLQPLDKLLAGATTLLVSPDGPLHLVPMGALRDTAGRWRLQTHRFVQIHSGRELLRVRAAGRPMQPPVVVAAPEFGGKASPFTPLPGTAQEGEELAKVLPGAKLLSGSHATEHALRNLQGPGILHVATHGFFSTQRTAVAAADSGGKRGAAALLEQEEGGAPSTQQMDAFLRSGLALAGANGASDKDKARQDADDGLLTASEAALLDLQGTRLVVLSACETGIGAVAGAEGVVGLRRSLVLAGAESQVMSLWKVSDDATRDLMIAFYRKLMAGEGRAEAMRQGQLALLASPKSAHPYYWAAFVVSGDWRPL